MKEYLGTSLAPSSHHDSARITISGYAYGGESQQSCPGLSEGLPKRSWAKVGQVRTIAGPRLGERLAVLPSAQVDRLVAALNILMS